MLIWHLFCRFVGFVNFDIISSIFSSSILMVPRFSIVSILAIFTVGYALLSMRIPNVKHFDSTTVSLSPRRLNESGDDKKDHVYSLEAVSDSGQGHDVRNTEKQPNRFGAGRNERLLEQPTPIHSRESEVATTPEKLLHTTPEQTNEELKGHFRAKFGRWARWRESSRKPFYLSIVIATRNVDTVGFLFRLSMWLKLLAEYTTKYKLHDCVEVVLVDYNTDSSQPPLSSHPAVSWPPIENLPIVRIIEVPNSIHELINSRFPYRPMYWEYLAKNMGIRRARGEFIMVTNPDILINEPFWQFTAQRRFHQDRYYRMLRCDTTIPMPEEAKDWSVDLIFEFCRTQEISECWVEERNHPVSRNKILVEVIRYWKEYFGTAIPADDQLQGIKWGEDRGAAGDFVIFSKNAWRMLRGYPELPIQGEVDNSNVVMAAASGLKLVTFPAPFVAFHMVHSRAHRDFSRHGFDEILLDDLKLADWYRTMREKRVVDENAYPFFNDECWGLCDVELPGRFL